MKKTVYDCSALAGKLEGWSSLSAVKASMLEAIANIAVAVSDKDAGKALDIQCELMWVFEVLNTIEEVEQ